jgi:hypothetical protein
LWIHCVHSVPHSMPEYEPPGDTEGSWPTASTLNWNENVTPWKQKEDSVSFDSLGRWATDDNGSHSGVVPGDLPRTSTTADSPTARRDKRRSTMKGDLDWKCETPGCGWTFNTKTDLR